MPDQDIAFRMAVTQMVELGRELLIQRVSEYSKLNQCRDHEEQRALEKLYYNEIAATANVIYLFTGREISFQWQRGVNGDVWGGFALYEIMVDVPCDRIPAGVSKTRYSRYSGRQEKIRDIDWGKGSEQGKIVKVYELVYDVDANPRYVGGYLTQEFQTD